MRIVYDTFSGTISLGRMLQLLLRIGEYIDGSYIVILSLIS